jgi:small subunit ribosomal protein S16
MRSLIISEVSCSERVLEDVASLTALEPEASLAHPFGRSRGQTSLSESTMSVKIRLARSGAKKRPFYRIVAADARAPRDGRFLEKLGTYDPMTSAGTLRLDEPRIQYWIGVGAEPTDAVRRLMRKHARKPA